MELLIVSGLSGAGKSVSMHALEDIGYFCIDNIPAALLPRFVEYSRAGNSDLRRVAIAVDVRSIHNQEEITRALDGLNKLNVCYRVLFLEASDEVLCRRYRESRRRHPISLTTGISTAEAIRQERQMLMPLYERADYYLDTTLFSAAQNREHIVEMFAESAVKNPAMALNVVSFGFKYGLPKDADIVFDLRCLPNPFYVPELKHKTGLEQEVVDYVLQFEQAQEFLRRIESLLEYAIPLYIKEGKSELTICCGCTGGKHRSITFARKLGEFCQQSGYQTHIYHRDVDR